MTSNKSLYERVRLVVDPAVSLCLAIVILPIILIAACLIKIEDRGPVFYRQERIGKDAKIFYIFKLRTMIVDADRYLDASGKPTRPRVTRTGRILRSYSLDEFPQLLNIIMGEMALIGPRPILPIMLPYLTEKERRRFLIKPGVAGLAQVKGRNLLKWSRRFHYDLIYVARMSFCLDCWIAYTTIMSVIFKINVALDRNPSQVNDVMNRSFPQSSVER